MIYDLFRSDGRLASQSIDVEDIDEDETPAGIHYENSLCQGRGARISILSGKLLHVVDYFLLSQQR
jgi:hypothetical protein